MDYALDPGSGGRHGLGGPLPGLPSAAPILQAEAILPAAELARLIRRVAEAQDRSAFATLFGHFAPRLKSYLLRLGAGAAAAEDLAQETMLAVWRKAAYFDPTKAGASTWVFTIARNLRLDTLRRERHPGQIDEDPVPIQAPAPADQAVEAVERERRIRDALGTLPAEQAEVVRLAFFDDHAHAEIERRLGIPLGTVKSRLRLAMNRLRTLLVDFS